LKSKEAYPRLKKALAEYGMALGVLPAERAAALLRQRPPAVQEQLVAMLQVCWRWAPEKDPETKRRLAAGLTKADGDPWRQKVRQALESKDRAALGELLQDPKAARQPAAFLVWLSHQLPGKAALELLRRAQQRYPDDFWANFILGQMLYASVF